MLISPEQAHLILYEIAMTIGDSLDLRTMLRHSVSVYLRKLNCSVGGVFLLKENSGLYSYESVFSIPRNMYEHPVYRAVAARLVRQVDDRTLAAFCAGLPQSGHTAAGDYFHLMELPGFGLFYIGRRSEPLDPYMLKSLAPLNAKLAGAGRSCLQNELLQRSEEKFRSIFENAAVGIFQCTRNGELLQANPAFAALFGSSQSNPRSAVLVDPARYIRPEDADLLLRLFGTQDRIINLCTRICKPDGTASWILLNSRFHREKTGLCEYHEGTVEDISEKMQNEQMRLEKEAAEAANCTKSMFLATMSHELRTPMNAIIGFCDLLLDEPLEPHQTDYLKTIDNAAHDLLDLINDILDFSKIEAGKMDIEIEPYALDELLDGIAALMAPKADEKRIVFEVRRCPPLPDTAAGDPLRIRQCLINLLGNAIKFTDNGFVRLTVSLKPRNDEHYLCFEVTDTGIGIPKDKQKTIFESFTQADSSATRKYGGTGLGLAITAQLAELMGGQIQLESEPEKGSTFTLCLPLRGRQTAQADEPSRAVAT